MTDTPQPAESLSPALVERLRVLENSARQMAAAPIGLGRIGPDLSVVASNKALTDLLDLTEGDEVDRLWKAAPACRRSLEPALRRMRAGGSGVAPERHRLERGRPDMPPSGWPALVEVWLYPIPEPGRPDHSAAVGVVCRDVTAETALLHELDHRLRNTFTIFLSLVQGAARSAAGPDATRLAKELTGRVRALSRAHDLVSPVMTGATSVGDATPTTLSALVGAVIEPHVCGEAAPRIAASGPTVTVGPRFAPGLALVLHELATNALKHGALSVADGRVILGWAITNGTLIIEWREANGPALTGPPKWTGFGTRLMRQADLSGSGQQVVSDWSDPAGLRVRITVPVAGLAT